MKEIPLSKTGKHVGKYVALIDDEDYEGISKYNWFLLNNGSNQYAMREVVESGIRTVIFMHREIMKMPRSKGKGGIGVDHKDHNGLNCQKDNMRKATNSQNNANVTPRGMSKYLGVGWDKNRGKWQVHIRTPEKHKFLGRYDLEEDAAKAYDAAAKVVHGEFANLNFK